MSAEKVFKIDRRCITWEMCLREAAGNKEFIKQMDRLLQTRIGSIFERRSPIERMIDEATGCDQAKVEELAALVWELVWLRLNPDFKLTTPSFENYLKEKYEPIYKRLTEAEL